MPDHFPPDLVQRFADIEEIDIEPGGPNPRRTTIWVVTVGDHVIVRSVRGARGKWYEHVYAQPDGAVYLGSERVPMRAILVTDDDMIRRVSEAYLTKYHDSPHVPPMVLSETLPTTLRLIPR